MSKKILPIIIVVVLIVVVIIGVFIFRTLNGSDAYKNNELGMADVVEKPIINLSKKFEGEYPSKVIIMVKATTNGENKIEKINLPDGTTVEGDTTEYVVEENGVYKFSVTTLDGTSETLEMEVTEIAPISSNNPYIPIGFNHVEDTTVENGFTIEDEYGNQYVWIPVEDGKLSRTTSSNSKYEETSTPATSLVNSVAKYYGFYMAKYESSKNEIDGKIAAATMEGKTPWTNITYQEAAEASELSANVFGYEDCYTGIISSYAWDTTLAWIDKTVENFSSSTEYGNYSGSVYATGGSIRDIFNNICDLCGNVREWTTEIYLPSSEENKSSKDDKYRVIRSGSATLNKTVSSRIGYLESSTETYWGFRMVLYK